MRQQRYIHFNPFRLDLINQSLWRDGHVIPLTPKAFTLLKYLVDHAGQLVTKEELLNVVWPETYVTDAVLKVYIGELRKALGDDAKQPRFIETSHRRGYRFIGQVREDDQSWERVSTEGQAIDSRPLNTSPTHPILLVGREAEIAQLQGVLERAMEGQRQVVFVTGEPGMGKTALVEAFLGRIAADGRARIARGQCLEQYGASEAYLPVLDAVSKLGREPGRERIIELLRDRAPTWLQQMPSLVSALEREALQRENPGGSRQRMLREMAEMIETLSLDAPLTLALEDLHWSDYSTLDLVSYLARRTEMARLLLVCTYRPVDLILSNHPLKAVKQELEAHRQCVELPLKFLTEMAVAEYLAARFPQNRFSATLAELARAIHTRTDGNALFMVNVVDYLLARGLITLDGAESDERWELNAAPSEIEIVAPEGVKQMIEKQIDRLDANEQRVLMAASVAGVEFSSLAVAAAIGQDVIAVEECCERLARRQQFLRPLGATEVPNGTAATRYGFIHALYQNALYERVAAGRRAQLHRRIGEHEEDAHGGRASEIAAELAMHFERGCDYGRAAKYLRQASENASRRFANHEAILLARRGLQSLKALPDASERDQQELSLQIALGVPLMAVKGYGAAEVEQVYTRAHELCQQSGENLLLFPVLLGLWNFHLIRAEMETARQLSSQLLRLAPQSPDTAMPAALWAAEVTCVNSGEFSSALDHFERGVAIYDSRVHGAYTATIGHDPGVTYRCFGAWAMWSLGYPDRALRTISDALTLARQLAHPHTSVLALFFMAFVHQLRREERKTLEHAEATMKLSDEHGFALYLAFGMILRGWALTRQGQYENGIRLLREGLAKYRATGAEISVPHFLALLAEALGDSGQTDDAVTAVTEALALVDKTGECYYEAELYRLKGNLLLKIEGRRSEIEDRDPTPSILDPRPYTAAEECFHQAIEVARRQRAKSWELRAAISLSQLWRRQDKQAEADEMLAGACAWFNEGFDTEDMREAKSLLSSFEISD